MLDIRPIVVNEEMVVLGGNMRLKACQEAGLKEVPIMKANELTAEQQREFIVKDNVGFGEWDWDMVANEWDNGLLNEWGLDVWQPEKEIDYSILNEIDLDEEVNNMYQQTKKSIILEYPTELYENEVKEVYESLKKNNVDISNILLQAMQNYNS